MRQTPLRRTKGLDPGRPLERKTPLARPSEPLRRSERSPRAVRRPSKRQRERAGEALAAVRAAWYDFPRSGICEACGRDVSHRVPHHVLREQDVYAEAPDRIFDLTNRMLVCDSCHSGHHRRGVVDRRISYARVRPAALAFARELLGEAADLYFRRRYRDAP